MAVIKQLRAEGLHHGLLPLLDTVLDSPEGERFIRLALDNTDARVQADKPTSPGFLFAALFWPQVKLLWDQRISQGAHLMPALFSAADEVLLAQTENLAIQRRFVADMKEIWALQPRFQKRQGRMPFRLLEHPRYRAGYDFMLLRAQAGELPQELADWWTTFAEVDGQERDQMVAELAKFSGCQFIAASHLYRSAPYQASGPDYFNAVLMIRSQQSAEQLLSALLWLEQQHGRTRPSPNAPRTLDLDLLFFGTAVLETPRLKLPHPRLSERRFVLEPLMEIAPDLHLPGLSVNVQKLCEAVRHQVLQRTEMILL
jgi:2-amino-4-hydroxy-6-hydroxymethyldihydropteridine diphosphokinase